MRVPIKRTASAVSTCGGMSPCCLARVTASVNARPSTTPDFSRSFTTSGSSQPNSALAPDLHRFDQVAGRGGGKALRPEDGHCSFQHFVAIEFSGPHHGWHLILLWTDMSIT